MAITTSNTKFRLDNKIAIVYGGSYGIGKGICEVLSEAGATVIVVARNAEKGNVTVSELSGPKGMFIQGDVKKFADHERIVKTVIDTYSQIDIIVCCAGIYDPTPEIASVDFTNEFIDNMLDVNIKGSIYAVKTTVPHLTKSKAGRIIFISSITGEYTGFPGLSVYGATKSAQIGFARSAAVELAPCNITVNCVLPGNVLTEGLLALGEDYLNGMKKTVPLKKLGTPKDIGNAVLFLTSNESGYITGQEITVDGGQVRPESLVD